MRWLVLVLVLAVGMTGCTGGKKSSGKPKGNKEQKKDDISAMAGDTIGVAPGDGTYSDSAGKPLWDVKWEVAQIDPKDGGKAALRTVSGKIYEKGKAETTFEAEAARIDRKKQILVLHGAVRIVSSDPAATLTCDLLRYEAANPKRRVIKAVGNVRVDGAVGSMGPTDELWASPDLNVIATPSLFDQP